MLASNCEKLYDKELVEACIFIKRDNRFVATIKLVTSGEIIDVHVKNTGRCKELLIPGARGYVVSSLNPNRKYQYDLIAVYKGDTLVNFDSQAPNKVVFDFFKANNYYSNIIDIKREVTFGNSRFDIYIERLDDTGTVEKIFVEVKGVTLFDGGIAMFPDAPTKRGVKHVHELIKCKEAGYKTVIFFLIQARGLQLFKPNLAIDPEFSSALKKGATAGVEIICYDSHVTCDNIVIENKINIELENL